MKKKFPADPLAFIKKCVRAKRLLWTWHVNMRMKDRHIPRNSIIETVESYEIIETYLEDKYLPSYLVYAKHGENILHLLFAVDVQNNNAIIVTAYRPDPKKWNENFKRRK